MPLRQRQTTTRRNLRAKLSSLLRLEDRLTPSIGFAGPYSASQVVELGKTGASRWEPLSQTAPTPSVSQVADIQAINAWYLNLDTVDLADFLADAPQEVNPGQANGSFKVAIPSPAGYYEMFRVWEVSIMEPGLAAQFPTFHTYRGQGIDDPYATLAADVTDAGFHAQVLSPNGAYYVDPYFHLESTTYVSYFKRDNVTPQEWHEPYDGDLKPEEMTLSLPAPTPVGSTSLTSNGATLRTYRAAVAANGEYTAFFGGTVALGQAAVVTAMNRVDGVYEMQLSIRMVLVANNNVLVYTNSATDPYTNGNGGTMLTENQNNIDSVIGSANYDIGHVFSTGGGGVAGLGVVGVAGNKARGVTGNGSPTGDSFWIDYVAHEMGHQFGGNHTFNSSTGNCGGGNRNAGTAYEQGSGNTIMSYAGICGTDNLQPNSDPYFHWKSLDEISTFISVAPGNGNTQTATGNAIPVVTPGGSFTIPAQTPFFLTGSATDANGDPLTYLWEEADLGVSTTITTPDNGTSPIFRSFNPSTSPTRYFPNLTNLLANTNSVGEVMPSTTRTLNWRLTVFDNKTDGAFAFASRAISVVNTGAAFLVTSPNTAVSYQGGSTQTVTWNVAGTTANGINAANVDIYLSTDGGLTFPTLLGTVPNNGSANVNIPNTPTSTARIKVQGSGNIFFDVSNVNFTITPGSAMQVTSTTPAAGSIITGPTVDIDFNFSAAVAPGTVGTNDITVNVGTVTNAQVISAQVVRYTISGLTSEGTLNVNMANGAVTDTLSNPVGPFAGSYTVDISTAAFSGLTAVNPRGTLGYTGTGTATINTGADTDAFTITLDAGQSLSATVVPAAGLQPNLNLTGPGGTNITVFGSAAGKTALLQTAPITVAGVYTFTISSVAATTGSYTLQAYLNSNFESEAITGTNNNSTGNAQSLGGFYDLGLGHSLASIRGRSDLGVGSLASELEANDSLVTANDAAGDFVAGTTQLYQMQINGSMSATSDSDYFSIGALDVGDIITVTMSGADGGRGTMSDPRIRLYRAGANTTVIVDADDRVAGTGVYFDSLIYRFTVTIADTYYLRSSTFTSTTIGTYQMGVYLENTGAAPTTGSGNINEAEANGTVATANNAGNSWKRVNYNSNITGAIGSGTDVDYYKYTFAAGDVVTAIATSGGGADTSVAFYNSAGVLLYDEKGVSDALGANSAMFGYNITAAGNYYVRVSSTASTTGSYTLDVNLSTSATPPVPASGEDYFSFTVTAGQPLALGIKSIAAGNLDIALLDSGGMVMANGTAGATNFDKLLNFTPASSGTWFARVTGDANVDYQAALTRGAAQDSEANDSFATAQPLTNNHAVGAIIGNDDWYSVALTAGQVITLTTTTPGGAAGEFVNTLDPIIELYDPSNMLVGSDDNSAVDGKNAVLSKGASVSGTFRVHVSGVGGSQGEYTLAASIVSSPPPIVSGLPQVDDGNVQRSRVRSLTVSFNKVVTLPVNPADAFQLARTGPGAPLGNVTLSVDTSMSTPTQTIAKLTFSGALTDSTSLVDGLYTLTAIASQITDGFGQQLDGDGNGTGGDNFNFNTHRLFGDIDGDRAVAANDFIQFRLALGGTNPYFDFDNDGAVAANDFIQFRLRFGGSI